MPSRLCPNRKIPPSPSRRTACAAGLFYALNWTCPACHKPVVHLGLMLEICHLGSPRLAYVEIGTGTVWRCLRLATRPRLDMPGIPVTYTCPPPCYRQFVPQWLSLFSRARCWCYSLAIGANLFANCLLRCVWACLMTTSTHAGCGIASWHAKRPANFGLCFTSAQRAPSYRQFAPPGQAPFLLASCRRCALKRPPSFRQQSSSARLGVQLRHLVTGNLGVSAGPSAGNTQRRAPPCLGQCFS